LDSPHQKLVKAEFLVPGGHGILECLEDTGHFTAADQDKLAFLVQEAAKFLSVCCQFLFQSHRQSSASRSIAT
jgi:hypothetical protein